MIPTITTWLFNRKLREREITFEEVVRFCAAELDAIAIEIPNTTYADWSPRGLRELKRLLHRHGIFCAVIAAQNHFNCETHAERRREVQLTKDFVDIASFVGAPVLNIFHAGWGDADHGRKIAPQMLECLKEVVAYAETRAVILAVESHGPLTDNVAEFKGFVDEVASEYLRINFDTGNMAEGPEGNLKLLDYAAHVHVKPRYRDSDGKAQDAEVARVLKALKQTGYRGTVTLEHVDGDPLETLPGAFADFKAMLASLET